MLNHIIFYLAILNSSIFEVHINWIELAYFDDSIFIIISYFYLQGKKKKKKENTSLLKDSLGKNGKFSNGDWCLIHRKTFLVVPIYIMLVIGQCLYLSSDQSTNGSHLSQSITWGGCSYIFQFVWIFFDLISIFLF